jgi:ABC-2 type transport system ATP-binding protein
MEGAREGNAVFVKNLGKEFKSVKKEAGFLASLKSLIKSDYTVKPALKNISLEIKKGEIIGLIGPNGAGKSTLIKILSGVLYPDSGEVKVLGYVPWKERLKYTKNLGVVFGQKTQLYWDLPAVDAFELNKGIYEISDKDYEERLRFMIKLLDAEEFVKKQVRQLSLGERMRCEIIQALLHNPKIVFFDEPTIGLDIIAKEKVRDFILEMNRKYGTTFILTTHDMGDIEKLCERVVIINHGRIVYDGLLKEVRKKFANKKVIDCRFLEPIVPKVFNMAGCKTLKRQKHQIMLELDLNKNHLWKVVDKLMKMHGSDLDDMEITDPPIEEIIAAIYRK